MAFVSLAVIYNRERKMLLGRRRDNQRWSDTEGLTPSPDLIFRSMTTKEQSREYQRLYKRKWRKGSTGRKRREEYALLKRELKKGPCVDCGKSYPPEAMDFDHLPGVDKKFKISGNSPRSKKKLLEEITKCELVCVLCHRTRTFARYDKHSQKLTCRKKRQLFVNSFKDKPCELCGIKYNVWQMDFDHKDPSRKTAKLATLVHECKPEEVILKEILKCRLLCALCHRIYTVKEQKHLFAAPQESFIDEETEKFFNITIRERKEQNRQNLIKRMSGLKKPHTVESKEKLSLNRPNAQEIEDSDGIVYRSIAFAARELGISSSRIRRALKNGALINGKGFKKVIKCHL